MLLVLVSWVLSLWVEHVAAYETFYGAFGSVIVIVLWFYLSTMTLVIGGFFNAGLGESWAANAAELRFFDSVDAWIHRIEAAGFEHTGDRIAQAGDPSDNVLMAFRRLES